MVHGEILREAKGLPRATRFGSEVLGVQLENSRHADIPCHVFIMELVFALYLLSVE